MFPASLSNITLSKWVGYIDSLQPLNSILADIDNMPDSNRKEIMRTRNTVNRAYHTYHYFGGKEDVYVEDVLHGYSNVFCRLFDNVEPPAIKLPPHELVGVHPMTFGQFIDAKMLTQGAQNGNNNWALFQYIAAIFLCEGEYSEEYTGEGSEVFKSMGTLPMNDVVALSKWWEALNEFTVNNYTLFQDSGEPEKANMKEHMQRWGWVNFLKSIAKTKVFDISGSGLNSIDCARKAKCVDVLGWASEEKDYNIALSRDMKE